MLGHSLEGLYDVFLGYERHLAVNLCEFRLSVGTQVFVAEAFHDLEIAVESRHHKQLLESLRTLRQGIELSRVHARGHDEVACSLRS